LACLVDPRRALDANFHLVDVIIKLKFQNSNELLTNVSLTAKTV